MAGDEGLPRPEDSLTWALQAMYAARASEDANQASHRVLDLLELRSPAELRDVAAALAVLPLLAGRPLTDLRELDRLAAEVQWGVTG